MVRVWLLKLVTALPGIMIHCTVVTVKLNFSAFTSLRDW